MERTGGPETHFEPAAHSGDHPRPFSLPPRRPGFLEVHVQTHGPGPALLGLCAGFENGVWRADQFARELIRQLIEFVFPRHEWPEANAATAVEMTARAAKAVYSTTNIDNRGEIGELMLFSVLRTFCGSLPVISKLFFKSAANDTVKGFDAVHFVRTDTGLELWLGEAKFYADAAAGIRQVVREIEEHIAADYLRAEFAWINNKLMKDCDDDRRIAALLDERTSLDAVFDVLNIPVLVTYESPTIAGTSAKTAEYVAAIREELERHHSAFVAKWSHATLRVHLILVPLGTKRALQESFDRRLTAAQLL
jgi:Cap4 SAVED domain